MPVLDSSLNSEARTDMPKIPTKMPVRAQSRTDRAKVYGVKYYFLKNCFYTEPNPHHPLQRLRWTNSQRRLQFVSKSGKQ